MLTNFVFVCQSCSPIIVVLALMSASLVLPSASARKGDSDVASRGGATAVSGSGDRPIKCKQVPHDSLWIRLNLGSASYHYGLPPSVTATSGASKASRATNRSHVEKTISRSKRSVWDLGAASAGRRGSSRRRDVRLRMRVKMRLSQQLSRVRRDVEKKQSGGHKTEPVDSWHCHMTWKWKQMPKDTFPPYLQTGRCKRKRCMAGPYECTPRKYIVKVLRRINSACYPVPLVGQNTTYEDAWAFRDVKVTVGCDCVRKQAGKYDLTQLGANVSR